MQVRACVDERRRSITANDHETVGSGFEPQAAHDLWPTLLGGCATFAGSVVIILRGRPPAGPTVRGGPRPGVVMVRIVVHPARPASEDTIPAAVHDDVETLWVYHRLGHELRHTEVGVGLGSHDIGVAVRTVELYRRSLFPLIVFTGANAPTTIDRFPRGEAVHYRERALEEGVPDKVIRVEPKARNTGENMTLTRDLLSAEGITPKSVTLASRPYQERRAFATCRKLWPEVELVCTSQQVDLDAYAAGIGDIPRMINVHGRRHAAGAPVRGERATRSPGRP